MSKKILTIDGNAISDIPSLYEEINRVFMAGEDWKLGPSLDALDDMLYGDYGAAKGDEPVVLIWQNMDKNRADLGFEATREFYREKLRRPEIFDLERISRDLDALERGAGPTYFEIVLQIIAGHPHIELLAR
ncbi:barstar family protein [Pseudochelatococcus lubricantis]|uniref:barstar family protein n=1 Tax=Pseudochelatococcus lubricantis TaxID=1538102 RepID=UPI0035E638D6